ncbi:peptidylglycine alpha-hydroxylating monooxygenase-like isoform X1 [Ctenocephalides felis]|uniref:peptidylglycine alpha-hydroxylating monooxygenase-like isoform X1 n=1 Tax=Ctenocephalides felis TaxID=7515 RepID=UPI000E6E22CA|nr:peptidylglycine alpha-hydroxylating monooxygenase-like isoform X1 [Ctenocephalides felis]
MKCKYMIFVAAIVYLTFLQCVISYTIQRYSMLMPDVKPNRPELYLCTPVKVDYTKPYYIVGFEPKATMNTAHHMLLYGCEKPGSDRPVWNCGEMAQNENSVEETASPCSEGSQIIYAWAMDAPKLELPQDVGFKVGKNSTIKYLVLQVHYAHIDKFKDGSTDDSGIFLHYTSKPMTKLAGVLLLGTGGAIGPMTTEHFETICTINEDKIIHPFAYRTHTHSLGKVVSGYKVRTNESGLDEWTELGKRNPLTPQMFYPVFNNETINRGDKLAARCTMTSLRTTWTHVGSTNADEMCNFYLMYWSENDEPLDMKYCFTAGPPYFYWSRSQSVN